MTDAPRDDAFGKGFAPGEGRPEDDEKTTPATATPGSGKQFAPGVTDPVTDERPRRAEGSGKQFARDVDDETEIADEIPEGSGKQFRPSDRDSDDR